MEGITFSWQGSEPGYDVYCGVDGGICYCAGKVVTFEDFCSYAPPTSVFTETSPTLRDPVVTGSVPFSINSNFLALGSALFFTVFFSSLFYATRNKEF